MTTLEDIQEVLNDIPAINAGGCGVAALAIYRYLKTQGRKPRLALLYKNYDDLEYNQQQIEEGNFTGLIVPTHVCVIWKGQRIDSRGTDAHHTCGTDLEQPITENILIELLNTGNHWNRYFDRRRGVSIINKKLSLDLADVEVNP